MPARQINPKTRKAVCIDLRNKGWYSGVIFIRPRYRAKSMVTMPRLNICPSRRMVPITAEAVPYIFRSTELMIALVLGDEKRANPTPRISRQIIMNVNPVDPFSVESRNSPVVVSAIPKEATIRGSIRSEMIPANGESMAMTIGWAIRIIPVAAGLKPLVY